MICQYSQQDPTLIDKGSMIFNLLLSWKRFEIFTNSLLKSDSHLPKKFCFICFIKGPLKMMKNAIYFILKALFVRKIFKFLLWLFGHVEKPVWLER